MQDDAAVLDNNGSLRVRNGGHGAHSAAFKLKSMPAVSTPGKKENEHTSIVVQSEASADLLRAEKPEERVVHEIVGCLKVRLGLTGFPRALVSVRCTEGIFSIITQSSPRCQREFTSGAHFTVLYCTALFVSSVFCALNPRSLSEPSRQPHVIFFTMSSINLVFHL